MQDFSDDILLCRLQVFQERRIEEIFNSFGYLEHKLRVIIHNFNKSIFDAISLSQFVHFATTSHFFSGNLDISFGY